MAVAPMALPLRPPLVIWSALTPWLAVCGRAMRQVWDALSRNSCHMHRKAVCIAGVANTTHHPPPTCMLKRPRVPLTVVPPRAFLEAACLPGAERPLRLRPRVCWAGGEGRRELMG